MALDSPQSVSLRRKGSATSQLPKAKGSIDTHSASVSKDAPLTTDRVDRTSFSSVHEMQGSVAQSFTDSKLRHELTFEDVFDDEASFGSSGSCTPKRKAGASGMMLTNPQSLLHGVVCPCNGFKGWKGISIRGKVASKSFGDLRALARWDWDVQGEEVGVGHAADDAQECSVPRPDDHVMSGTAADDLGKTYTAGSSPFEMLPMELLGAIIDQLAEDIPPNGFTARNIDLMSLLLTSRAMHAATLSTLYRQITIPHSRIFRKFLSHVSDHPALGTIVRRLDFSHFNPTGAGMTARERAQMVNLVPETLLQSLLLTPNLREFLAQEHIDDELDFSILKTLFCGLPKIKAIDFCACSSTAFRKSFDSLIRANILPTALPITRLGLHECASLPSNVFDAILPKLTKATHLDVSHTRLTDPALRSLPLTARLTHLNLSKCSYLTGASVVEFLTTHPAAKTLVYLNLAMDVKSHEMLSSEDLTALLPSLPTTLRSLHLKGSKMGQEHIPFLLPLTKHLEELGLGQNLELRDITKLFVPDQEAPIEEQVSWIPHTLHYLDISDLSAAQLDLGGLFGSSCPVLKTISEPLEVVEIGPAVIKRLEHAPAVKKVGWCLKEAGRRGWLVRASGEERDSGARSWKLGATYWGMRKIPVAVSEVGGMYGHYMFKR